MSVSSEITRIINAKQDIKSSLYTYNIDVSNNTIDKYANIINPTIVLNDITPYNLYQASFNPDTKVLSFNADANAFAALHVLDSTKDFSFSFRLKSATTPSSFRFNLASTDVPIVNTDTRNLYKYLISNVTYLISLSKSNVVAMSLPITSTANYFKVVYSSGFINTYESSDGVNFNFIAKGAYTFGATGFLTIVNISAQANVFDFLKFSQ